MMAASVAVACEQKMVAVNDIGMCAWVTGNALGLEESVSGQADHNICVLGIKVDSSLLYWG